MLYGKLLRFTYRLERNPVFASVKRGLLLLTPVLIVGAVALMLRNLPIPGFQEWIMGAAGGAVYSALGFVYDATIGIMSLCLLCGISYSYAATISGSDRTFCLVAVMASLGSFFILFSVQSNGVFEFASLGGGQHVRGHFVFHRGYGAVRRIQPLPAGPPPLLQRGHGRAVPGVGFPDRAALPVSAGLCPGGAGDGTFSGGSKHQ